MTGNQLLVLPAWLDVPQDHSHRMVLRLDPGSAFGTGSHPTTRLCLEALEKNPPLDLEVADIGCGSGILGIASIALGAKHVTAVDLDSLAVRATSQNACLNKLTDKDLNVFLGSIDVLEEQFKSLKVDLLVCNTLAPILKELAPKFSKITSRKSRLLLSGLLLDQVNDLTTDLSKYGWKFLASNKLEKWAAICLCRNID